MKKYVNTHDNKCESYLLNHIKLGDTVIVLDGSYMKNEHSKDVFGVDFRKNKSTSDIYFELLKVVEINKPFPTVKFEVDCLIPINNCKIKGFDGNTYYCSNINIQKFNPCQQH